MSVSIGGTIAVLGDEPEHVLARADAEMYAAKPRRQVRAAAPAESSRKDEQPDS